jgi:hypothetical protein
MTEQHHDEKLISSRVYDVPQAGSMVGLSRNSSYEAAARGEIPTIKIGRLLKVPKAKWDRIVAGDEEAA